ncbi:hypothetical protein OSK35_26640, partial [Escherichia coli]|nr:hypothetical protein [Escherichia coli]
LFQTAWQVPFCSTPGGHYRSLPGRAHRSRVVQLPVMMSVRGYRVLRNRRMAVLLVLVMMRP